jgi:hypothetical protein
MREETYFCTEWVSLLDIRYITIQWADQCSDDYSPAIGEWFTSVKPVEGENTVINDFTD